MEITFGIVQFYKRQILDHRKMFIINYQIFLKYEKWIDLPKKIIMRYCMVRFPFLLKKMHLLKEEI